MKVRSHRFHAQRGIALIAVLWLTVLLTVIASSFAYSMRGEALAARNTMSLAQARAVADGAVERVAFELSRPRNLPDVWSADGQPHVWNDGEIAVTAAAFDETARIDLNAAPEPLLKGLLQNAGGLDPDAAQRVRRGDPRLARRRRAAPAERCRGRRLPRRRVEAGARQRAVRERRRIAAGHRRHARR